MNVSKWHGLVFATAVVLGLGIVGVLTIPQYEALTMLAAVGILIVILSMLGTFLRVVPTVIALWIVSVQVVGMIKGRTATVQAISDVLDGDIASYLLISMLPDALLNVTRIVVGWSFFSSLLLASILLGISWGVNLYTDYQDNKEGE